MSKTFKSVNADAKKDLLVVLEVEEGVNIHTESPVDRRGVSIAPCDAPALCLAILEAAGVEACHRDYESYDDGSPAHLQAVMYFLKQYSEAQAKRAAAEADRVKLEAEAMKLWAVFQGLPADKYAFADLDDNGQECWLAVARAARELNKEAGQ